MAAVAGNVAATGVAAPPKRRRALPQEASIALVLVGIAVVFELLGWTIRHQSFLGNPQLLLINGALTAYGNIPAFIATLGMMVTARGLAQYYTHGQPISMLSDQYTWIGSGARPLIIFVAVAVIFPIALRHTKYGKYTYAIGGNPQAARVSGINVSRHLVVVYAIAGLLSGLG